MNKDHTWLGIILLILLVPIVTYINVWVIHWAVNLFTPISMWQAFGLSVLINIIGAAFRKRA